jgi:hypothetical protein
MVAALALSLLERWRVAHEEAQAGCRIVQAPFSPGFNMRKPKGGEFELTDLASGKALYVYRLLVRDKVISPMSEANHTWNL